jgi:ankyrin repeat protein
MNARLAIDAGDANALRQLLAQSPQLADEQVRWGEQEQLRTHPLHYVCDKSFDKTITDEQALALVETLLAAGSDSNGSPEDKETPLHGAASLGAEEIGLRLLEAGADPHRLGGFRETPLHWAAALGLVRLCERLIEAGADIQLKDLRYKSSPLGWAEFGRKQWPGRQLEVIALLTAAGAEI